MSLEYDEGIPCDLNLNPSDSIKMEIVLEERKEFLKFYDEDTIYEELDEAVIYEGITHIFGTLSDKIEFIGFKSGSGKMCYTGNPNKGHPFLQGLYKSNLHTLKIGVNKGIRYIKTGFKVAEIFNKDFEVAAEDVLCAEEEILISIKEAKEKETNTLFPYLDEGYLFLESNELGHYYFGLYSYLTKQKIDFSSYDEFYDYLIQSQLHETLNNIIIKKDPKKELKKNYNNVNPVIWNQVSVKTLNINDLIFHEKNLKSFIEKFIAGIKSEIGQAKVNKKLVNVYNKHEKDESKRTQGNVITNADELEERFNKILNEQFKINKKKELIHKSFKTMDMEFEDALGNETNESGFSQNTEEVMQSKAEAISNWKSFSNRLFNKLRKVVFVGLLSAKKALEIMANSEEEEGQSSNLEFKLNVLEAMIKFRTHRKKFVRQIESFIVSFRGQDEIEAETLKKAKKNVKVKLLDFREKKEMEVKQMKEAVDVKRLELAKKYEYNIDTYKIIFEDSLKKYIKRLIFEAKNETQASFQRMFSKKALPNVYIDKDTPQYKKVFRGQSLELKAGEYTDDAFPPEQKSICPLDKETGKFLRPEGITEADIKDWDTFSWARADKILSKGYEIFYQGIQVTDIMQNKIGNCYFLSAVAALSIFPELVLRLFREKEVSTKRQYGIYIRKKGIWQLMLLDDYFPVHGKFKKAACCFSQDKKELWVMLLEKAWSKLNNSYAATIGGEPSEVFDVLTNASSEKIFFFKMNDGKKEKLWSKLVDGQTNNFIITVGTNQIEAVSKKGLVAGHAYTLLCVNELENGTRLVKLRNPWSTSEWNGDWCDQDTKKWTKEILEKVDYTLKEKNNDGIFYMEFNDFIKYFFSVSICKIYPDYIYNSVSYKPIDALDPNITMVKVDKATKAFFQLHQTNPRFDNKHGKKATSLAFILICDEKYRYLASASSDKPVTSIEVENLEPGYYYIYTDINYVLNKIKVRGYNITSYSQEPIQMEPITNKTEIVAHDILSEAVINYSERLKPEVVEESEYFSDDKKYIKVYIKGKSKKFPFIFAVVDNPFDNIRAEVKFTLGDELSLYEYTDFLEFNDQREFTRLVRPDFKEVFLVARHYNTTDTDVEWNVSCIPENDDALKEVLDKKGNVTHFDELGLIVEKCIEYKNGYFILLTNKSENNIDIEIVLNNLKWVNVNDNSKNVKFQVNALQAIMINLKTINRNQAKDYYYIYES
jgi:hypothetical protein